MVGAQRPIKMASTLSPVKNITSETTMIDSTTKSIIKFIVPMRSIKFLIILCTKIPINILKSNLKT